MTASNARAQERRYFTRINYRAYATLVTTRQRWPVHIMDLSFNGVLAALIHKHNLTVGEEVILTVIVDGGKTLKMQGRLSHLKEHFLGIECRATNIDSQILLRDLLDRYKQAGKEQGDTHLERDLAAMIQQYQDENASR